MKAEAIAQWMREVALEKSGYTVLTRDDLVEHHERLEKIYYHAGRYAEGARDTAATFGNRLFQAVLDADN